MDGRTFGFHVTYVPMEYIGTPEEHGKTLEHRIAVPIAGTTVAIWKLSENDLVKLLFEFARKISERCPATRRDLFGIHGQSTYHFHWYKSGQMPI